MKPNKKVISTVPPAKHPGEVLLKQFMKPLGLSANQLSLALHVAPQRVGEILNERRGVTAETALRLSKLFGTTAKYWLDLQTDYELGQAEKKWAQTIDNQVRALPAAGRKIAPITTPLVNDANKDSDQRLAVKKLGSDEKKVFDLLSDELTHFDVLCRTSGMDAGEMSSNLTMLEFSELVKRHPGDYYSKTNVSK